MCHPSICVRFDAVNAFAARSLTYITFWLTMLKAFNHFCLQKSSGRDVYVMEAAKEANEWLYWFNISWRWLEIFPPFSPRTDRYSPGFARGGTPATPSVGFNLPPRNCAYSYTQKQNNRIVTDIVETNLVSPILRGDKVSSQCSNGYILYHKHCCRAFMHIQNTVTASHTRVHSTESTVSEASQ